MSMKKVDFIAKYGKEAYQESLAKGAASKRKWHKKNPTKETVYCRRYRILHPEQAEANRREQARKGGKYYNKALLSAQIGVSGAKHRIRNHHRYLYGEYKKIIAPGSQIHHEWIPGTADYRGVALVETDQHMHGIVNVIEILDGEITLLGKSPNWEEQ